MNIQQIEDLRNMFKQFVQEWLRLGFANEFGGSTSTFNELYISPLRANLEIAMHNDRIAPLGIPGIVPFALVMPRHRVRLSRQYDLYGFKSHKRFINYLRLDSFESAPAMSCPYIISNVNCGGKLPGKSSDKDYADRMLTGEHRINLEELFSIFKLIDLNPLKFKFNHQVVVTGAYLISDNKAYVPYADLNHSAGTILNYCSVDSAFSSFRKVMTYQKLYKG